MERIKCLKLPLKEQLFFICLKVLYPHMNIWRLKINRLTSCGLTSIMKWFNLCSLITRKRLFIYFKSAWWYLIMKIPMFLYFRNIFPKRFQKSIKNWWNVILKMECNFIAIRKSSKGKKKYFLIKMKNASQRNETARSQSQWEVKDKMCIKFTWKWARLIERNSTTQWTAMAFFPFIDEINFI